MDRALLTERLDAAPPFPTWTTSDREHGAEQGLAAYLAPFPQIVRLRFAGLSIDDTAADLGVSAPTFRLLWTFARAWRKEAMDSDRT